MASSSTGQVWNSGSLYEPYVGRWSARVAEQFLSWICVPPDQRWIDIGCGTGALSATILATQNPRSVRGIDPSVGFIEFARQRLTDDRAVFSVGDAHTIPAEDASVDAVVSGLVLNFVPAPQRAVAEFARALRSGGVAAAYVWDYAGEMQMLRHFFDAAAELDPRAYELDEGRRFPLCRPKPLMDLWVAAELRDVEVRAIDVPTIFRDFDDYWGPFLGGQGPAPAYVMSLDEDHRVMLREHLRNKLPTATDGSISLVARAWAVRGAK